MKQKRGRANNSTSRYHLGPCNDSNWHLIIVASRRPFWRGLAGQSHVARGCRNLSRTEILERRHGELRNRPALWFECYTTVTTRTEQYNYERTDLPSLISGPSLFRYNRQMRKHHWEKKTPRNLAFIPTHIEYYSGIFTECMPCCFRVYNIVAHLRGHSRWPQCFFSIVQL